MRHRGGFSRLPALRGAALAALIVTTFAFNTLRDALVYAPNGAEIESGASAATATVKER